MNNHELAEIKELLRKEQSKYKIEQNEWYLYDKLLKFIDVDMNHIEAIKSENQELLQEIRDLRDELDDRMIE